MAAAKLAAVRASSRLWLLMCAAFGSLSCIGGPISDFPGRGKNTDEDTSAEEEPGSSPSDGDDSTADDDSSGDDGDDDIATEPPRGGGKRDAGASGGGKAPMSDAGSPTLDAGTAPPPTAGGDATDGGVDGGEPGASCTPSSDSRSSGGCYGAYCDRNERSLAGASEPEGACGGERDLALSCDGEIARSVLACAQRQVLSLGMGRSVLSCAQRVEALREVSDGCLDCYVDEVVCSLRSCLVACFEADSRECATCRAESCGAEFAACSGLPLPQGARDGGTGDDGVRDAGLTRRF